MSRLQEVLNNSVPLIEQENIEPEMTFELKNESGVFFEKGDSAFWVKLFGSRGETVEGKFFVSGEGQEKLLIFEPGMPGDTNKWIESEILPELIRQGYSVFCIRHSGTKINVENSDKYINCPERIKRSFSEQNAVIGKTAGKNDYTLEDIAYEPKTAIEALQKKFKQIFFLGHSNGVLGMAFSLAELSKEITDKVRSFVGLSGFTGRYIAETDCFDAEGRFNSQMMKEYLEFCSKFISLGSIDKNIELQKNTLAALYKSPLPGNINLVLVNCPKDEFIPIESSKEYREFIGRGLGVTDKTQNVADFHDLKNLQAKTLVRLLEIHRPKSKHTVTVKKEKIQR